MKKETVLITGASGGIGRALAKIFAQNKFDLVLVARTESKLVDLKKRLERRYGICAYVLVQDMTADHAAADIAAELETKKIEIDILVNNAGFGDCSSFLDSEWGKQRRMVHLNILALMEMTYIFGKQMRARGNGRILNLSSAAAFSAGPYMAVYYASKAFVLSFSEAVREELKGTGITVTALCPGPTATGFERAAEMKDSSMFTFVKPQRPDEVAEAGYLACMAGKPIQYHSIVSRLSNLGARLSPRSWSRKISEWINR